MKRVDGRWETGDGKEKKIRVAAKKHKTKQ